MLTIVATFAIARRVERDMEKDTKHEIETGF